MCVCVGGGGGGGDMYACSLERRQSKSKELGSHQTVNTPSFCDPEQLAQYFQNF